MSGHFSVPVASLSLESCPTSFVHFYPLFCGLVKFLFYSGIQFRIVITERDNNNYYYYYQ